MNDIFRITVGVTVDHDPCEKYCAITCTKNAYKWKTLKSYIINV